jgi:hypothetical protein
MSGRAHDRHATSAAQPAQPAWTTRGTERPSTQVPAQGSPTSVATTVNVSGLKLTNKLPATVGTGDKFRFVARVGDFNEDQCLFFLDPVSTEAAPSRPASQIRR